MKNNIYLKAAVWVFVMTSFLTACTIKKTDDAASLNAFSESAPKIVNTDTDERNIKTDEIKLPDIIDLHYKEINLESTPEARDLASLKKVKEEKMGKVDAGQINITLYSDQDNNIHGVFKYGGKQYILRDLGYASDLDLIEINEIEAVYNANGEKVWLVSGIGSSTLGYQYIIFNEANEKWLSFHNWGTSQVVDINNDGIKEMFLQFKGLHNNLPDLNVLSFQEGHFMLADINDEIYTNFRLDTSKSKITSTFTMEQNNKVLIEVSDLLGSDGAVLYYLEYDVKNPSLIRLVKNK